jgi:hypothetical protein
MQSAAKVRFPPFVKGAASGPERTFVHDAANGSKEPILWKNTVLQAQKILLRTVRERLSC